jgi:hypothetical protein
VKISDIFNVLAREPFNIPPHEAALLTMDQIEIVLRDPKDRAEQPVVIDYAARHRRWALLNRVPEWYAAQVWRKRGGA